MQLRVVAAIAARTVVLISYVIPKECRVRFAIVLPDVYAALTPCLVALPYKGVLDWHMSMTEPMPCHTPHTKSHMAACRSAPLPDCATHALAPHAPMHTSAPTCTHSPKQGLMTGWQIILAILVAFCRLAAERLPPFCRSTF